MRRRIAIKQFMQKITAIVSALWIAFALAGLNTDQAVAMGK
jgi:preprotein translocase subunit SecG